MSLFQCDVCGCCDNTALALCRYPFPQDFDWTGIEDRQRKALCSACAPTKYSDGTPSDFGQWHGQFKRVFLPPGMFKTNERGNLAHKETGDEDFRKFALPAGVGVLEDRTFSQNHQGVQDSASPCGPMQEGTVK